jgi:DNA-binding NtrC family response regulator
MIEALTRERFGEPISRKLRILAQRLMSAPYYIAHCMWKGSPAAQQQSNANVLAITADLGFYSCVQNAANVLGWRTEWVRSIKRGLERCASDTIPIVIYDRNLPDIDWRRAIGRLSGTASLSRVLLASEEVDEDLWQVVLRRRGYDVLARSSNSEQMQRELKFAWLSLQEPALYREKERPDVAVLSRR